MAKLIFFIVMYGWLAVDLSTVAWRHEGRWDACRLTIVLAMFSIDAIITQIHSYVDAELGERTAGDESVL